MEPERQETMMNGISVEALDERLEAVKAEPVIAAFTFRARNAWVSGGVNRTVIDGYYAAREEHSRDEPFVLVNDEPPVLLGADTAASPVETLFHAMAGCITTSLITHATARGIRIDAVETRFSGDLDLRGFLGLDPSVRNGYSAIKVNVSVTGDAEAGDLADLVRYAQDRSPLFDVVMNGTTVNLAIDAHTARDSELLQKGGLL